MALCLRGRHFRKGVWASSSNIEVHNQIFYQRILCKHLHIFTYSDGSITKPFYNVFDRVKWIPHGLRASIGLQQSLPIFACAAPLLCIFTALHRQLYFHIYNTSKSSARVEQYHMTILTRALELKPFLAGTFCCFLVLSLTITSSTNTSLTLYHRTCDLKVQFLKDTKEVTAGRKWLLHRAFCSFSAIWYMAIINTNCIEN